MFELLRPPQVATPREREKERKANQLLGDVEKPEVDW